MRVDRAGDDAAAGAALAAHHHAGTQPPRAGGAHAHVAHRGRQAVQIVPDAGSGWRRAASLSCAPSRSSALTTRDGPSGRAKTSATPGDNGFVGQLRPRHIHDGEHQRAGAPGAQIARGPERGRAAGQIEQHGHVAALELVERAGGRVGPQHFERRRGQRARGFRALVRRAADVENLHVDTDGERSAAGLLELRPLTYSA